MLNQIGTVETATGLVEHKNVIVEYILAISRIPQVWSLGVFALGVLVLASIHYGPPRSWVANILTKPLEPQAIFVARDNLENIFRRGNELVTTFQFPERTKPTFEQCESWNKEALACARQQAFVDVIGPKEMARYRESWDQQDCRRNASKAGAIWMPRKRQ